MDYQDPQEAPSKSFDPIYYLGLALRYRWLLIIPFCLAMVAGTYLAITLPREYETQTLILVESQKVPSSYVQSLVTDNLDDRIATLSQQIKSRTNLIKIINEFNLFSEPKYKKMYLDDKLEELRDLIKVKVTRSRRATDAFSISFRWHDPEKTMKVTSTLATYFINQNLKYRESYALSTKQFLDDELLQMRSRLERVEQTLKTYRKKYMGELPEQLDSNLSMLDRLQENLSSRQQSLRENKNRLSLVEIQLRTPAPTIPLAPTGGNAAASQVREPSSLDEMKQVLAALKSRYTDKHPDIVRLEKRIALMESKALAEEGSADATEQGDSLSSSNTMPVTVSGPDTELLLQKRALQQEIAETEKEIRNIRARVKRYQKRVENTPKREQELLSLRRDYDNIQESYNSMLARKLEADIAVNMEKKQKGEQFRIIDPAAMPTRPVKPDMRKLFLFAIAAGLGLGAGIIFLLDFMNSGVKQPETFEPATGVPVLATIPPVLHARDTLLRRINQLATVFGLLVSMALFACFAAVTIRGSQKAIALIIHYTKLLT